MMMMIPWEEVAVHPLEEEVAVHPLEEVVEVAHAQIHCSAIYIVKKRRHHLEEVRVAHDRQEVGPMILGPVLALEPVVLGLVLALEPVVLGLVLALEPVVPGLALALEPVVPGLVLALEPVVLGLVLALEPVVLGPVLAPQQEPAALQHLFQTAPRGKLSISIHVTVKTNFNEDIATFAIMCDC